MSEQDRLTAIEAKIAAATVAIEALTDLLEKVAHAVEQSPTPSRATGFIQADRAISAVRDAINDLKA